MLSPIQRAAATSVTLMAAGDVISQAIARRRAPPGPGRHADLDLARTARFAAIGLLHGPFFYKGFRLLDARFGAERTLRAAATKTLVGQVTLFPVFTSLFLMATALLEGAGPRAGVSRVADKAPGLLVAGTAYWPAVNMVSFMLVPPERRVLAVNVAAIGWNAYLSFVAAPPAAEPAAGK
ncbi:mpv17l2 [Scenedesmus sp. PABB004]|nr:mpv17l2 [Scenedesmus sp. PABB004]